MSEEVQKSTVKNSKKMLALKVSRLWGCVYWRARLHCCLYCWGLGEQVLRQPEVESKRKEIREKIKELKQADAVLGKLMNCQCETIDQCVTAAVSETL